MRPMIILPEISYQDFRSILDGCFPDEQIEEQVFLNNISRHQFLFAGHEDSPRGYLLFDLRTHPARLIQLCVTEEYRSHGIGSFLMVELKKMLIDQDVSEIILNVDFDNHGAIKFYQKHGFIKESTNTQFSCHPSEMKGVKTSTLEIAKIKEIDRIQEELHVGEFMAKYINQSSNNELYSIKNKMDKAIGHFLFNPSEIKITHFELDNPKIANELIVHFLNLMPSDSDLLIESLNIDIDHYMAKIPGMATEYKLQVMKFNSPNPV